MRGALLVVVVAVLAALAVSGDSSSDPRTPPALPGLPPPFLTTAVLGGGGLTAGIDAYGDVVDLRPRPAGHALISVPLARQQAGSVAAADAIVPRVSIAGGRARPLWRADSVRQGYLPETNVLRTTARFGSDLVRIACAVAVGELGCVSESTRSGHEREGGAAHVRVSFGRALERAEERVHLDDRRARRIIAAALGGDRRWLARARPLGAGAPAWALRLYLRSLLVLHALTGRDGAVAAGARDGWAYVWPRDAAAASIALAAAGYRGEARRVVDFLRRADLGAAARFDGFGRPVPGRAAQGDAFGWAAAAARAAGLPPAERSELKREARKSWRDRADYQEKAPGEYLGNALAARSPAARRLLLPNLDSAAAWAVRPFARPELFAAARGALAGLERAQLRRFGPAALRFGLVPSEDWPEADPWTAPTAWSAWSLAALGDRAGALRLLVALHRAETPAGVLPERVDARTGRPASTAPLAWSHAFAILAIRQLWPGTRQRPRK